MKNKIKVILAALLALTVVFSLSVATTAVDTGKITITNSNPAVSMKGHTYNAYKIFDVTYNEEKTNYDYTLVAPYITYFAALETAGELGEGEDLSAKAYDYIKALEGNDAALQQLGKELKEVTGASAAGSGTAATATEAEITGLTPGYYVVYDMGAQNPGPDEEKAIANVALTTTTPNASIILKASVPTIDKKITGVSDTATNATSDTGLNAASATLNQHIGFQIDSNVPDLNSYTDYLYEVSDEMSAGLTPDNNAKVTIGDDELTAGDDYTVTYSGQLMTINIPYNTLKNYTADTAITITYSAYVNSNAKVYPDTETNVNNAAITYSNNINDTSITTTTPPDDVYIYLFPLEITKTNGAGDPLQGATFNLTDSSNNTIKFVYDDAENVYNVSDDAAASADVTSGADGKINIKGLAAGTYSLVETVAPQDYNVLKNPVSVVINPSYNDDGTLISVTGTEQTVVNRAGGLLPTTGGIGTYIFTIGGALLMITAIAVLVLKKKKETAE